MSVLLVIGNGFDLTLNNKTSYSDYFNSDYNNSTRLFIEKMDQQMLLDESEFCNYFFGSKELDNITCWDILFYRQSIINIDNANNEIKWCDIEAIIKKSLTRKSSNSWEEVQKLFRNNSQQYMAWNGGKTKFLLKRYMILKGWDVNKFRDNEYYEYILNDLNMFEKKFGEYIKQITSKSNGDDTKKLINNLIGDAPEIDIDTFNYSEVSAKEYYVRHINGDCNHPIFGIDLKKNENTMLPIERFTKTARRIKQDSFGETNNDFDLIDNAEKVVVYGHSLNEQDYDYFFYIFTLLKFNTLNVNEMGKIEFTFMVYDRENEYQIINEYSNAVYKLLNSYEDSINNNNQRVLINLLRFSGKLVIREIDKIDLES